MTYDHDHDCPYQVYGKCSSHVEQEPRILPDHLSSATVLSVAHVTWSLVFCVVFCRSLFVPLSVFSWPMLCLSFFGLRLLITHLVSSNFSSHTHTPHRHVQICHYSASYQTRHEYHKSFLTTELINFELHVMGDSIGKRMASSNARQ